MLASPWGGGMHSIYLVYLVVYSISVMYNICKDLIKLRSLEILTPLIPKMILFFSMIKTSKWFFKGIMFSIPYRSTWEERLTFRIQEGCIIEYANTKCYILQFSMQEEVANDVDAKCCVSTITVNLLTIV